MLNKTKQHINTNYPFLIKSKLLIANSGGVDSMVASYILKELGFMIALAHCNFNLRGGDSDKDAVFVKNWAQKNNIYCHSKSFKTKEFAQRKKLSVQVAARQLRYNWFDNLLVEENYDYLITAHHANDNLETVLFNFTRGTGFKGLLGIPAKNNKIIRPFLPFSREEIENFAHKNNIQWREDKSNASAKYTRNRIRHKIIPVLEYLNPNLIKTFNSNQLYLKGVDSILSDKISEVKKEVVNTLPDGNKSLNIVKLRGLSNPQAYLYQILSEYGFTAWEDMADLLTAQSGKQIYSKTHRLLKDRDLLILSLIDESNTTNIYEIENLDRPFANEDLNLSFETLSVSDPNFKTDKSCIFVDRQKINLPLKVRRWQKGDYFYPFGMQNKKKLSAFFKDQKMTLIDKEKTWLLCSDEAIVWIIGHRLDNRFRITENTKEVLKINYTK